MLKSEELKKLYFKLHKEYSQHKIKRYSRKKVKSYLKGRIMTDEQKKKVRNFYKPYKNITTDFHEFYYQKTGKFFDNYLPDDLYYCDIDMYYNDWNAGKIIDNKCFYNKMLPEVKQPESFASRVNGFWYDENMKMVPQEQIINNLKNEEELFIKYATDSAGGKGVFYIENTTNNIVEQFRKVVVQSQRDIIIQRKIKQHKVLASLNSSSVNTIRVLSLLSDEGVKIYSSILRMGIGGSRVDNASSGGITCGIDKNGCLKELAYSNKGEKFTEHPTSKSKFTGVKIPKYNEICDLVVNIHPQFPHFRLISWDIAIDEQENIVLIELGLHYGELDFHQLNNGPVFGEDTKKILDEVFSKKNEKVN